MKNGHSEDDTFHTLSSKTENFKSNFYYETVTLKLIDVKRKLSAKRVCGYFSHPLDVLKQFLNKVLGPADIVVET